jgi:hypothetical protein
MVRPASVPGRVESGQSGCRVRTQTTIQKTQMQKLLSSAPPATGAIIESQANVQHGLP